MSPLHKMIIRLYDEGFEIQKISSTKFYIKHSDYLYLKKKVIVEHLGGSDFIMYQSFAKRFSNWKFNNYSHYVFLHHYKKLIEFDSDRIKKIININAARSTMKLFIKHRKFNYDGDFAIKIEIYKGLYNSAIQDMKVFLEVYRLNPDKFMMSKDIPNTIKYVCHSTDGDLDNFIYGEGWTANTHYIHRLVVDILKYTDKVYE